MIRLPTASDYQLTHCPICGALLRLNPLVQRHGSGHLTAVLLGAYCGTCDCFIVAMPLMRFNPPLGASLLA